MNVKDTIADEFNEFSKNYTEDMVRCVPYYLELLENFNENLPQSFLPKTILDLGCGNGNITHTLVQLFPKAQYTLVDASQEMLDLCQKRFELYNVQYIHSYFNDFDFKANTFDMVAAGFSLHHCITNDKKNIYKKIYNTLKPNGVFACSDLMIHKNDVTHKSHLENWESFVLKNFPSGEKWSWLMEHYNQFDNPDSVENHMHYLKSSGFKHYNFNINDNYWVHFKAIKK